jgi:hypothetical protein
MARGGARPGSGRPKGVVLPKTADKEAAGRILEALNKPEGGGDGQHKDTYEESQWRLLTEAADLRIRLDARKYLYDKRDGKATQPIDHGGAVDANIIFDVDSAVARRARKKP